MTQRNKKIIAKGCKLEGAGEYYYDHCDKYPTYDSLRDEHNKVHDLDRKLKK